NTDIYEKDYLASKAHIKLAEIYSSTENYEESVQNAQSALKLAKANNFYLEVMEANKLLSETNEKLGLFEAALCYNRNIVDIKDSIFTLDKSLAETKTADNSQTKFMKDEIGRQEAKIE